MMGECWLAGNNDVSPCCFTLTDKEADLWLAVEGHITALLPVNLERSFFLGNQFSTPSEGDWETRGGEYWLNIGLVGSGKGMQMPYPSEWQWWHYAWLSRPTFVLWPQCLKGANLIVWVQIFTPLNSLEISRSYWGQEPDNGWGKRRNDSMRMK